MISLFFILLPTELHDNSSKTIDYTRLAYKYIKKNNGPIIMGNRP